MAVNRMAHAGVHYRVPMGAMPQGRLVVKTIVRMDVIPVVPAFALKDASMDVMPAVMRVATYNVKMAVNWTARVHARAVA